MHKDGKELAPVYKNLIYLKNIRVFFNFLEKLLSKEKMLYHKSYE